MNSKTKYPGAMPPDADPEIVMMICTAGHVDHGKTRLVKLLTGCSTDRLKSEQERGLTIELGFAPCTLPGDLAIGIVDVPGHDKFIRNMVAGVSGIQMALLVIAADDGVMPQTVEHLDIMRLLGVERGMVVLSKIDLVDDIAVEIRREEIEGFLQGSFLEGCPICPVSSETGEGFAEFYDTLCRQVGKIESRQRAGVFRMPIERAFSQEGLGTVVTGIPLSGSVSIGDSVEISPGGLRGKVRGIQCFSRAVDCGSWGKCLALNLADVDKSEIERGQVLGAPGYLAPATLFHVRIDALPGIDPPIRNAEVLRFHTGTAEEQAKVYLLEERALPGGQSAFATVMTAAPVVASERDRFVLRAPAPRGTVAGGSIRMVSCESRRPRRNYILNLLSEREEQWRNCDPGTEEGVACRVDLSLCTEFPHGASCEELSHAVMLPVETVSGQLDRLLAERRALRLKPGKFMCAEKYKHTLNRVREYIESTAADENLINIALSRLRSEFQFPEYLWDSILEDIAQEESIDIEKHTLVLHGAVDALPAEDRLLMERILCLYEERGFNTPRPDELPGIMQAPEGKTAAILEYLISSRRLLQISPKVVLSLGNFRKAQSLAVETIEKDGGLNLGDFKQEIGSTRKYALAILECLDRKHITARHADSRRLIRGYQDRLV